MSLLLGIDLGKSFIKVAVVDSESSECLCTVQYPELEMEIVCRHSGWVEQDPVIWWENICTAVQMANASGKYNPQEIAAIGIAYQMHGLVLIDRERQALRPSIIGCDIRATDTKKYPSGNFIFGKLAWVQEHEPEIYEQADKAVSPGDYIAVKMTGELTTTPSVLSEVMFWNLDKYKPNTTVFSCHGFKKSLIPPVRNVFAIHGNLLKNIAESMGLPAYTPVSYKAGDRIDNALSLSLFEQGEVVATGGSGAIGAAIGAGIGAGLITRETAFENLRPVKRIGPANTNSYNEYYELWKQSLISRL